MSRYRNALPQLGGDLFLTDGGIETTLIFREGFELPHFAAFLLLRTREGEAGLSKYFRTYAELARKFGAGLILESATWRASSDWAAKLGVTPGDLAELNRQAVRLLERIRSEYESDLTRIVLSGCIGPRGDGYVPKDAMSAPDAERYHQQQVDALADTAADMLCAITMNYAEEAVGIARAAKRAKMPVAISFTVETDGNLPTGQTLRAAIEQVDGETSAYPSYYMINCAHPTHFDRVLASGEGWVERIRGLRANASRMSHAELNEAAELDAGNPAELGQEYAEIAKRLGRVNVMGGCCGTDDRHVERIAAACSPFFRSGGRGAS